MEKIGLLKKLFKMKSIDGYIIPKMTNSLASIHLNKDRLNLFLIFLAHMVFH